MGLLGAASEKPQYELVPMGEYVWTLAELVSETGQYGEQVKWVFLLSPFAEPDAYLTKDNGEAREVWQFTKPSLSKGSRAREWAEALIGRELKNGEEPDDGDLERRRMIAYLGHKPNKNDPTIKREAITEGTARPFATARPSGAQPVSAQATQAEIDAELAKSEALRKKCQKMIRNAQLDDHPKAVEWGEVNLAALSDDQVAELYEEVRQAMLAAV
jgi:hypothetical protein